MRFQSPAPARRQWYEALVIIIVLFASFSPYLTFDFGFHNDFEIWAYDNKTGEFPENPHLIRIGRFLQAILQNVYLSFFTDLRSLVFGRAFGIAFACLGAIMLSALARKRGMDRLSSAVFGAGAFLLPPSQVNLGWITNFVPGLFNAAVVLTAAVIFPDWALVRAGGRLARLRLAASFLLLLAALYIYPPTVGFFLIPAMVELAYSKDKMGWTRAAYPFALFVLVCLVYFVAHRFVYMQLVNIVFPDGSFYRFDVASDLPANAAKFLREIVPAMLSLWNPAPSAAMMGLVVLTMLVPAATTLRDEPAGLARRALWWLLLFLAANGPGLLAVGRPPSFYRAWHPGTVAVLIILIRAADSCRPAVRKGLLLAFVAAGCLFSIAASLRLATTLSHQFQYAVDQFGAQFSPNRERYVLVEKRRQSLLLGSPFWGELGFIHILSRGHGIYILKKYFNHGVHPIIETVVAKQERSLLILEPDLLEKSSSLFPRSPAEAPNKPFDPAFDFRVDTFFESVGPMPTIDIVGTRPEPLACYKIHAGTGESPARAPRSWTLAGSSDGRAWTELDRRSGQVSWRQAESRIFTPMQRGSSYRHYRLAIGASNEPGALRIPELQLFTRVRACLSRDVDERSVDPALRRSIAGSPYGLSVTLGGTATESGLSDPPFRLQRALDNIYYTFWETLALFPIGVDFRLFEPSRVESYAFQAGDDKAHDRMPRSWRFLGSKDGLRWIVLDSRDDETGWLDNGRRVYRITSPGEYSRYRIEFLSTNGGSHLRLYELALAEDATGTRAIP